LGQNSHNYTNELVVSAKIDTTIQNIHMGRCEIYATATIRNNSADTIRYYHDICENFFKSDNKEISLDMVPCDTGGSVTEIVLPHQTNTEIVHLHTILSDLKSKKFRIGFIYFYDIHMCGGPYVNSIMDALTAKKSEEAIKNPIWSNTLYLK